MLDSLTQFCQRRRSVDGIESPLITLLSAAMRAHDPTRIETALQTLRQMGRSETIAAGPALPNHRSPYKQCPLPYAGGSYWSRAQRVTAEPRCSSATHGLGPHGARRAAEAARRATPKPTSRGGSGTGGAGGSGAGGHSAPLIAYSILDPVLKARLTKDRRDDIAALTNEEGYLRRHLAHTKRNTKLYHQILGELVSVHSQIQGILKQSKANTKLNGDADGFNLTKADRNRRFLDRRFADRYGGKLDHPTRGGGHTTIHHQPIRVEVKHDKHEWHKMGRRLAWQLRNA